MQSWEGWRHIRDQDVGRTDTSVILAGSITEVDSGFGVASGSFIRESSEIVGFRNPSNVQDLHRPWCPALEDFFPARIPALQVTGPQYQLPWTVL